MSIKRYTPRKTPYTEMWKASDGEYVRYADYAALENSMAGLQDLLREQSEQLEAIGAGGVSGQRITANRN